MNSNEIINVEHLIVSSSIDYTSDYICIELKRRGARYLRINRDKFREYEIWYSVDEDTLYVRVNRQLYSVNKRLISVYFRAPVFLRSHKVYTIEDQLYRSQWNAFIRNLVLFKNTKWINNPVDIYRAENKLYQLDIAKKVGLDIPCSYVTNIVPSGIDCGKCYVIKSLDTALFYSRDVEMFTYTTVVNGKDLRRLSLSDAPVIMQEYIEEKLDLRVTVVGEKIYPVKILKNGALIEGDWRKTPKEQLSYVPIDLPKTLEEKIHCLMKELNLVFGGIDLVYSCGKYYFIEVNPTGEWGWLINNAKLPIDRAIVDFMEG